MPILYARLITEMVPKVHHGGMARWLMHGATVIGLPTRQPARLLNNGGMTRPESPTEQVPAPRGRGRPRKTQEETDLIRQRLKQATAVVYGEHGHHGLSVELILQAADLSRPTFYRYFRNAREALDVVLLDVNERLIQQVTQAIEQPGSPMDKVDAGLLAWRQWGDETGPALRAIFAELYDLQSPNHLHRQRVLATFSESFQALAQQLGRPRFSDIQLEAFLFGVEFLGYRYHFGPQARTPEAWQSTRQAMIRLALGMLGSSAEWAVAPQLAASMGVPLDG